MLYNEGTVRCVPMTLAMPVIKQRHCGSMAIGAIPEGCRLCEEGAKMVLFVTGLCSYHCFYCPVSDEKMYKDVVYATPTCWQRRVRSARRA